MKGLKDRVVLITGAGSGIGKAAAERFVAEGAKIVVAERDVAAGEAVATALHGHFVRTDVTDPSSVEAAVAFTVQSLGSLDILVNNAGIESRRAPIHDCSLENWRHVLDVDLNGVFYGMKFGIAQLVKQGGGGSVVNLSSTAGLVGMPDLPPYTAAKAAVVNLTRSGALEYGRHGIRVNAVAPTAVMTDMNRRMMADVPDPAAFLQFLNTLNPLIGMPTADDIAAAVVFLASDDARFISGVTLPVDGAFTAQ
jgi:meso-butanediol dehydrogenase/(S,S)-butanediol dehydrogenase/diacetyl reductase